jgi:hypothetical protein
MSDERAVPHDLEAERRAKHAAYQARRRQKIKAAMVAADKRVCVECGYSIAGIKRGAVFCSRRCRSRREYREHRSCNPRPAIATSTSGAIAELVVSADLMAKEYAVFRAVSPACACDLVVIAGGVSYRVEVRTGERRTANGRTYFPWSKKDVGRSDVLAVVVDGEIEYRFVSSAGSRAPFLGRK